MKVGRNAFGTTWCLRTIRSGTPLARAIVTKSSFTVSTIDERMMIAYSPM